mgnify:CR=1 FL=1
MRGGKASGVSGGGSVFRVRRIEDVALLVVQWALVLLGLFGLFVNVQLYYFAPEWTYPMAKSWPDEQVFRIDVRLTHFVQGLTFSLVAVGLGAWLFYFRRLYLSKRQ